MYQYHMHLKAYISFRKESSSFGALMGLFVGITIMIMPVRGKLDEKDSKKDQSLINAAKSYRGRGSDRKFDLI